MAFNLKRFQIDAIGELHEAVSTGAKNIVLESGTGSGKTIILSHFIHEFMINNPNYAVVWFSPGNGELEEQSKDKMERYIPKSKTKILSDIINTGFYEGDIVFINWELVTKTGNKAMSEGEHKNLRDRIAIAKDSGLRFLIIVDEEHLNNTSKAYKIIELFAPDIIIRASATPKIVRSSVHIKIPEEKVIQAGLIKKMLIINEDIDDEVELTSQVSYLLDKALKKQNKLEQEFLLHKVSINPLIVIQVPNSSESLIDSIEEFLKRKSITYQNGELAVWLTDKKENLEDIQKNTSPVKAIIIKQAIATGWDCPRAHILVKLRDGMSEKFEIQTIGRIRRMPEAKHYGNTLLDNCYLYTFDEKFKNDTKTHLGDKTFEGVTLKLKDEHNNTSLKKEKISTLQYEVNPKYALNALIEYFKIEYKLEKNKYKENENILSSYGFNFDKNINLTVYKGSVSSITSKNLSHLNHVTVKMILDTHEHGRNFHQATSRIARTAGITYDSMATIVRRLFCSKPEHKEKFLNLEPKELYAFVINNREKIEYAMKKAMSDSKYMPQKMIFSESDIEEEFYFPKEILFTYDSKINNFDNYDKNVYEGYISSAAPRSQGEKLFEIFCEENDNVEWFYKNGDKGNEFFSIVYRDNSSKKHHFYPDYIVNLMDNLWIIEVKGGESANGKNEDIDIYSGKKMEALIEYVEKYNLNGGFVRLNKSDMRLYISTTEYKEDMSDSCWQRIDKVFS